MVRVNTIWIQAKEFEADKDKKNVRALQLDFAMMYEYMYQNEVQNALWSRGSVNLFTTASISKAQSKIYLIPTDSKHKVKTQFLYLLNIFMIIFYTLIIVTEMFRKSYGQTNLVPRTKLKNKYTVEILPRLTEKYNKPFSWKFFATSHGKGILDRVGGNCKSIVPQKTFSKGKARMIVQNAKEFADPVSRFVLSTKVAHIDQSLAIDEKINSEMLFERTVRVPGITKAHMIHCTSHSAKLWRNCGYQLDQPDITVHFNPRESTSLETNDESAIENDAEEVMTDFEVG